MFKFAPVFFAFRKCPSCLFVFVVSFAKTQYHNPEFSNFTVWGRYLIFHTHWVWVFEKFRTKEPLILAFEKNSESKNRQVWVFDKNSDSKNYQFWVVFKNSKNLRVSWKNRQRPGLFLSWQLGTSLVWKREEEHKRIPGLVGMFKSWYQTNSANNPQESWNYKAPPRESRVQTYY